jgi:hypothetical protein
MFVVNALALTRASCSGGCMRRLAAGLAGPSFCHRFIRQQPETIRQSPVRWKAMGKPPKSVFK